SHIREISGGSGFMSQNAPQADFGLGSAMAVDTLIISWPSGVRQVLAPVTPVNRILTVTEPYPFADATSGPLGDTGNGRGVAWGDFANAGDLDLDLSNVGQANKLFRDDGGGPFVDATSGPLGDAGNGMGVAWGDYDNDGDLDLYLSNAGTANKV